MGQGLNRAFSFEQIDKLLAEYTERQEREARWRSQHRFDGPMVCVGSVLVPTCSRCGADASEMFQRP